MTDNDTTFMRLAIDEAKKSKPEDNRLHPKVGALVVQDGELIAAAYRGEIAGSHAEYVVLEKKLTGRGLANATLFTTLEPCSARNHPKIPCAQRIINRGITRVVIGTLDPNPDICGRGVRMLSKHRVKVEFFPTEMGSELEALNKHFNDIQEELAKERSQSAKTQTIRDFQEYLHALYGDVNEGHSLEYIYGYLSRTTGYLAQRVASRSCTEDAFVQPLSWLFALASKLRIDVQDEFLSQYPLCCSHCLGSPCICSETGKRPRPVSSPYWSALYLMSAKQKQEEIESRKNYAKAKGNISLDSAADEIAKIYPQNQVIWSYAGAWRHMVKLFEEVSEIHEALADYIRGDKPVKAVANEIADVFAWIVGAWHIEFPLISLDEACSCYFFTGCPACSQDTCTCARYHCKPELLVDARVVVIALSELKDLALMIPAQKELIEELIESVGVAAESKADSITRLALTHAIQHLVRVKRAIPDTPERTAIADRIDRLVKMIDRNVICREAID